jgi:formate hydrogenlyase transcriptional activator
MPARGTEPLRLLVQVAEAIATHRDLAALFCDLARRLPSIVAFECIGLFLHDPGKNVMRARSRSCPTTACSAR